MKRCDNYTLQIIHKTPYLLPFGQANADQRKGMQLNEAAMFLWNHYEDANSLSELFELFVQHYEACGDEILPLKEDFDSTIRFFQTAGLVDPGNTELSTQVDASNYVAYHCLIAGINICLSMPHSYISDKWRPFQTESSSTDLRIHVQADTELLPYSIHNRLILKNKELIILENETEYILFFPEYDSINRCIIEKKGENSVFYTSSRVSSNIADDIFLLSRTVFLYTALQKNMFACHSASVRYQNQALLFSAPAGTGKSTHASLWNKLTGSSILNGDLNLLDFNSSTPVVRGIPWCGTSGISTPETFPLLGIVFLSQAETNTCFEKTLDQKILSLSRRLISPSWNKNLFLKNLEFSKKLIPKTIALHYSCNMDEDAVFILKNIIDQKGGSL